jgi:hypothetical protein
MKIITKQTIPTEVMTDVLCDSCNKSCNMDNVHSCFEFAEIKVHWGYYSNKDTEYHEIVMCESCYDKMLELMKIKPKVTNYL